jgi:hypothetical protein
LLILGFSLSVLGIGGAVLLVVLVRSKWAYMSWGLSRGPKTTGVA